MARQKSNAHQTKKIKTNPKTNKPRGLFNLMWVGSGILVGVIASLSVVLPSIKSDLATDVGSLASKNVLIRPVDDALTTSGVCTTPSGVSGPSTPGSTSSTSPAAQAVTAALSPSGSSTSAPGTQLVSKLVSGIFANESGSISNTGPGSTNKIAETNTNTTTVTNTNDIDVSSNNSQSGQSGSSNVSGNTTGGNATSGGLTNSNSDDYTFNINN
ncbi:MAG TPA: hypothetical protein VMR34_02775 [Candidatus Saccharimonadales bacterium]|nr:hypothetical protein [Candidatus Saccharimonadales bacterium]